MMDKNTFLAKVNVSRETLTLFEKYEQLILKWNEKINLISPKTIECLWSRHFLDSAQVSSLTTDNIGKWVDFGSGAGFPGLVCAILEKEKNPTTQFTLIESDQRKSAFLMTVTRELNLNVKVISKRIESIIPLDANIITARALAPLPLLLELSEPHLVQTSICLFLKGANWREEIAIAQQKWSFKVTVHPSITDPMAVVLEMKEVIRV